MKVQTETGNIYVRWHYGKTTKVIVKSNKKCDIQQDYTLCEIKKGDVVLSEGSVARFHTDAEDKILARENAFKAAIAKLPRSERGLIWDEFRKSVRTKTVPRILVSK